jgi:hypothetical protein
LCRAAITKGIVLRAVMIAHASCTRQSQLMRWGVFRIPSGRGWSATEVELGVCCWRFRNFKCFSLVRSALFQSKTVGLQSTQKTSKSRVRRAN